MKHILIALMVVAIVGSASGLGLSDQVNVPTQAQLELIAKADSFSGKISKAHFVKGWGFGHMNMWIEVAADNGSKASFYIRENSSITDANGKYISMHDLPAPLANKKIEIRYSVITDAKNGLEKFETGKNGVLIIHFLDWKAKS